MEPRPGAGAAGRPGPGPLLALFAGVLALFLPVVLGGESFFGRDVTPFFYPMKHYLAESVAAGRFPLWNPFVAGGEPFFATLQPGLLYPGSLLLYLLPFPHSVDWLIVLHFVFAGAGWIVLLRREGFSPAAAAFGALAFTLGGFFVSLGNFVNNLQTMSWAPWLFLSWGLWLRDARLERLLVFATVCVGAFLGGEPQLLALVLALVLARGLVVARAVPAAGPGPGRQLAGFVVAGALALLVSAVQLLPFLEFIGESVRTLPLELSFSASRSQEPAGLLHLLLPPALGAGEVGFTTRYLLSSELPWLVSLYPGLVTAVFAVVGLAAVERRERRLWILVSVLGLVFALGAHTIAYRGAFELLPPLRALRYPEKFAALAAVAVPWLAAAGLDRWLSGAGRGSRPALALLVTGLACGVLALLLFVLGSEVTGAVCAAAGEALLCDDPGGAADLYARTSLRLTVLLAAAGLVVCLVRRGVLRAGAGAWLVVALAAADLVTAHRPVNPSVESGIYTSRPWAAEALAPVFDRRGDYRYRGTPVDAAMGETVRVHGAAELSNTYLDLQAMGPNAGQLFGLLQQDGLQGVELQSVAMTHDAAIHGWAGDPVRFLRMMNVRYYADATAGPDSMPGLVEIARHPELPIRLFEVPDPLPRAFVATGWETVFGPGRALQRSLEAEVPPRRVVLEREPAEAVRRAAVSPGRIVATTWREERVRLVTRATAPSVLVLLDRWYPGWRVTVDGEPAALLRANGVFRAVEVPAGEADVQFEYAPLSLAVGAALSAVGLLAMLGLAGWLRVRARTRVP